MSFFNDKGSAKVAPQYLSPPKALLHLKKSMDTSCTDQLQPITLVNVHDQKIDRKMDESGLISKGSHEAEEVRWLYWPKDQRPPSPPPTEEKNTHVTKKNIDLSSNIYSPDNMMNRRKRKTELIRESVGQAVQGDGKFKLLEVVREGGSLPSSPPIGHLQEQSFVRRQDDDDDDDDGGGYERGRLSKVVEESASFSMREFGSDLLTYMSTAHNSANQELNFANHGSLYDYRNRSPASLFYSTSSYEASNNLVGSKSVPAGDDVVGTFWLTNLRGGQSDPSHMRTAMAHHRYAKHRKPKTFKSTLMWPLVKIRDGYVGCMMGLEGAGDLTAMAQGSNYCSAECHFADVPLSKTDSRNHG